MNMQKTMLIILLLLFGPAKSSAQSDFFKGKQMKIVVGASAGAASDLYARAVANHLPKQIPGKPDIIVQNMPGGGSLTAANYVYSVAKPDGLTLGAVTAPIYFAQLLGRKEVQFDWAKFTWIGTPEENDELLFVRSDQPYKNLLDLRNATEPLRCGASGVGSTGFYIPKLIEEIFGARITVVTGYPGAADVDLAVEKNEVHCRGTTISAFFGREPGRTWAKNGFVRFLVQTGDRRNHRLPDTPTMWELMDQEKGTDATKRLARVILGPGAFGRPILATPGIPADRVKLLREAYVNMLKDPEFLAEAKKRQWEIAPVSGERLEALAKEVVNQPPEIIERMKKSWANCDSQRTGGKKMDLARYIVKARPGVLGGKHEEKRPLRQLSALPVKRYVFINRDSHPDADIYVAIHQAKDLPSPVPDYQVPHCHNTDEFYYFIGNHSDLTGLEGQIIFEGKVHKIISPACVYIPTGTVHEYKVTAGNGTVTVLFRNRGYTHEDKPFDVGKGERDFARYAGYIFKPEVRPTTEIKYHNEAAPGTRYVFVDGKLKPEASFYTVVRSVAGVLPTQANYVDMHRHNCDTQHIAIGTGPELTGLKIEFQIRDDKMVVESPVGVNIPAGTPHSQRIIEGAGHFFNFVPKSFYNDGLMS